VPKVVCELEVLLVLWAAENSVVFKWDLTEASETADQKLGSREFHSLGTAVEKVSFFSGMRH